MTPGDKLHAILEKAGIPTDQTVEADGHIYQAWPHAPTPDGEDDADAPPPVRACPYWFEELRNSKRRLTIQHPSGDRYATIGDTNEAAIDAMALRFGLTFEEGTANGK